MSKKAIRANVVARSDNTMTYDIAANEIEFGICESDLYTVFAGDVEIKKVSKDGNSKAMSIREFLDENKYIISHGYDKDYNNDHRLEFYSMNNDIIFKVILQNDTHMSILESIYQFAKDNDVDEQVCLKCLKTIFGEDFLAKRGFHIDMFVGAELGRSIKILNRKNRTFLVYRPDPDRFPISASEFSMIVCLANPRRKFGFVKNGYRIITVLD